MKVKSHAEKAARRAAKVAALETDVRDLASRLESDLRFLNGFSGRERVCALVCCANQLAQLTGRALTISGVPWTEKPKAIINWLG